MDKVTNIERLATLENEVKNVSKDLGSLCSKVDTLSGKFDAAILMKADKDEVRIIREKVSELDKSQTLLAWKVGLIVAILSVSGTYVINNLFSNILK